MERTPEQIASQRKSQREQAAAEELFHWLQLQIAEEVEAWKRCAFPACKRKRACADQKFSRKHDVSDSIRHLCDLNFPACIAVDWYGNLQEIYLALADAIREENKHRLT